MIGANNLAYILQGLTYISFGALCLFGLLAYFKDHKMYPMYPVGLKLSIISTILLVSIQIFLAAPNMVGLLLWFFLACLTAMVYFIIQMITAKTFEKKMQNRNFAIGAMILAIVTMLILAVFAYKISQTLK